jgi:rRNA maturation RNase YbeY
LKTAAGCLTRIPSSVKKGRLRAGQSYGLAINVVGSSTIRRLNAQYRRKKRPTDVLSFSQLEGPSFPSAHPLVGEIFLCWEVARKQAKDWENTPRQEMRRLTVHGILHLFGYDHERGPREAKKMFSLQDRILARIK